MNAFVYVVGHRNPDTDSVCSAIAYAHLKNALGERNVRPARAGELDEETTFVLRRFEIPAPALLTDASGLDLILVDHNEVGHALPHVDRANILEVWDHHRLGDLHPPKPIFFHCEPVGATSTLIGELYFARGVAPTPAMAGILLAAIVSDTVVFRSPTATEKDRNIAARLGSIARIDGRSFGEELLAVRSRAVARESAAVLLRRDYKEFVFRQHRVGIAQIEVMQLDTLAARKAEIFREMRAMRDAANLSQMILMITDVQRSASDLWFVGDAREPFERAFGPLRDGAVHLPGYMSRKKQIVPRLQAVLEPPRE